MYLTDSKMKNVKNFVFKRNQAYFGGGFFLRLKEDPEGLQNLRNLYNFTFE
jgi:hypothetical protein